MVKDRSAALDLTFQALADPTRRAIVQRLARGEATAGEVAEPFAISLPAVSKHIKVLEGAGLVEREREGRVHRLRLVPRRLEAAASWIGHQRDFCERALASIDGYLAVAVRKPKRR